MRNAECSKAEARLASVVPISCWYPPNDRVGGVGFRFVGRRVNAVPSYQVRPRLLLLRASQPLQLRCRVEAPTAATAAANAVVYLSGIGYSQLIA
jgi:hypothetical protein